jgi:hypothetical protein
MPFVKKVAVFLWASVVENLTVLLKIAMKSLFYGPAFYGISWLSSHHALRTLCGLPSFGGHTSLLTLPRKQAIAQTKRSRRSRQAALSCLRP